MIFSHFVTVWLLQNSDMVMDVSFPDQSAHPIPSGLGIVNGIDKIAYPAVIQLKQALKWFSNQYRQRSRYINRKPTQDYVHSKNIAWSLVSIIKNLVQTIQIALETFKIKTLLIPILYLALNGVKRILKILDFHLFVSFLNSVKCKGPYVYFYGYETNKFFIIVIIKW